MEDLFSELVSQLIKNLGSSFSRLDICKYLFHKHSEHLGELFQCLREGLSDIAYFLFRTDIGLFATHFTEDEVETIEIGIAIREFLSFCDLEQIFKISLELEFEKIQMRY